MNQSTLEKLLGRKLTPNEVTNLTLYMTIADQRLTELLCVRYDCTSEKRKYTTRPNYRTAYTDIFNAVNAVTVNGVDVTNYVARQFNNMNGVWFNSLVFNTPLKGQIIEIDADWGFTTVPPDMNLLRARMFDVINSDAIGADVTKKRIEDYAIELGGKSAVDVFIDANQQIIDKYGLCSITEIDNGNVNTEIENPYVTIRNI